MAKVDEKEMVELIEAYGFERRFARREENKIRFDNDNTFIDVWNGKKRVTIGIYNPNTTTMSYKYCQNLEEIESCLTNL